MKERRTIWRWWAKALGEKASDCDHESDRIATIRTFIFVTYLITNCFITAGVIRQWNRQTIINVEVFLYEENVPGHISPKKEKGLLATNRNFE